jgi:hypothetical protein
MSREEVQKLLGGYATGTLTAAEQEALFAAALEDQELFDALMKEQPLREVLRDPTARAELLAALDGGAARRPWWQWRPLIAGVAVAGLAAVAVVAWRDMRRETTPVTIAELKKAEPPPSAAAPAAPPVPAPQPTPSQRSATPKAKRQPARDSGTAGTTSGNFMRQPIPSPAPPAKSEPPPPAAPVPLPKASEILVQAARPQIQGFRASDANQVAPRLPGRGGASQQNQGSQAGATQTTVELAEAESLKYAKSAPPVHYMILRGDQESPPGTPLHTGETVRLRIISALDGLISITEGADTIASARIEHSKPLDTLPLSPSGATTRELRITFTDSGGAQTVLPVTLTYRP